MPVKKFFVLILFLVALTILPKASAAPVYINTLPYDIASPGYYVLNVSNTSMNVSYAIKINVSDVVLEGNDNVIGGNGTANTYGVWIISEGIVSNVTVKNLTIKDWANGIGMNSAGYCNITNNTLYSNTDQAISLYSSSNNTISNNNVSYNDGEGILITSSSNNNTITNNIVNGNGQAGGILCYIQQ